VHGYADEAVPYTESLRLAAARPARTDVILLHAVGHVEAARGPVWRAALDGLRLLLAFHALRCAACKRDHSAQETRADRGAAHAASLRIVDAAFLASCLHLVFRACIR